MSEQDSFINEVSEEVRRDNLFKFFKKYGWIPVVLIVAIVVGATVFEIRASRAEAEARAAGDAILSALENDDPSARLSALGALSDGETEDSAPVSGFLTAAAAVEAGNTELAIETLDAIAAAPGTDAVYRDLAVLKSVILGAENVAPSERIARLDTIAVPNAPFRLLALEQIAIAQAEAGETDAALETLGGLLGEVGLTQGLRQRVQQLIVALGGTLAAI